MITSFGKKFVVIFLLILCFVVIGFAPTSRAQTTRPQFLVTWSTKSYAPADYRGKIFPTAFSPITISFDLVDKNKVVNLSGQTIYWYFNDALLDSATGKQTATFTAGDIVPDVLNVRIEILNYNGGLLFNELSIPIMAPEAVLEYQYPANVFFGNAFHLSAIPYFFNVASPSSLAFAWSVNGVTPSNSENPSEVSVTLTKNAARGASIGAQVTIQDPHILMSKATANINLTNVQ